jgi:hypothetical protein
MATSPPAPPSRIVKPTQAVAVAVLGLAVLGGGATMALGEVARIEILDRSAFADGRGFGTAGAYEKITGRLHYAVDPDDPANRAIVDRHHAPRDGRGRIRFAGDFILLKPVDPRRGNRRLVYDVTNRGNLVALAVLNDAPATNDPVALADAGNGFLMERGYTVLWSAWNWDVLPGRGRLQIELPVAGDRGRPITGPVASEIVVAQPTGRAPIAWGGSRGYPPADPDDPAARLTVRTVPKAARRAIARERWRFVLPASGTPGPVAIELDGGFEPGPIYELVYRARGARVVGLGLAAIRDAIAFFRFAARDRAGTANPLISDHGAGPEPDPIAAIVFGVSQSGRVIQHMVWQGLHIDEAGRQVFDAALIHVAGGGKGSFNHRFAQTTRHPSQWEDHLYPADVFPFTTTPQLDPVTGAEGSVLDTARALSAVPYLFYSQTATEYWTRSASLTHTDVAGKRDVALDPRARLYVVAGAQHISRVSPARGDFRHCANPLDYRPVLRALLVALDRWALDGVPPPPSAYPKIADRTLGPLSAYRRGFPAIPGARPPRAKLDPPRLGHGPRFAADGIADLQPPRPGAPYVTLVPLTDPDGNDRAGIRLPAVAVPLGSYLGWNLRLTPGGAEDRLGRWEGSFLPFATTEAQRRASGDPRPSIQARYRDRAHFLARTTAVAEALVAERLLLPAAVPAVVERAAGAYDVVTTRGNGGTCRYLAGWRR